MIFAEMDYRRHYSEFHAELLAFINSHFSQVRAGLQGDSWIWIGDGKEKVAIDTFTAMKHQIKSPTSGAHVQVVLETLREIFQLRVYETPVPEAHEEA